MRQAFFGGHSVRASDMGSIMKAAEDWGNMHVCGRVPVETEEGKHALNVIQC